MVSKGWMDSSFGCLAFGVVNSNVDDVVAELFDLDEVYGYFVVVSVVAISAVVVVAISSAVVAISAAVFAIS